MSGQGNSSAETAISPAPDPEEEKRKLAYHFWEEEGRPEGRAEAHWDKACLVLMNLDAGERPPLAESPTSSQAVTLPDWLKKPAEPKTRAAAEEAEIEREEQASLESIRRRVAARTAAAG